jgi:hypothetical protein
MFTVRKFFGLFRGIDTNGGYYSLCFTPSFTRAYTVHPLAFAMHFMPVVCCLWCMQDVLHPHVSHCAGSGTISVDEFYGHFHGVQRSQFATRMFTIFGESHTTYTSRSLT